ncbi:autotransporter assembly complex protein TamA [Altererythrobacter lutimaris]|uniref:BamA/TamA family outer membrane protein n=1 Tax=Altererythrobacter lutimaris TaxID=2743979 RepID=A0A850H665_9SPHN|nr:BamA/TamA family outer membrane protein [Altererythrobacter lutimaris]NVE94724.1 BamA/TamA family outer membrane protein [Altererythrobacter lutimaris]
MRILLPVLAIVLAAAPEAGRAQVVPERLDDLIPEEAVENPEDWAGDQTQTESAPPAQVDLPPIDQIELDTPSEEQLQEVIALPDSVVPTETVDAEPFADLEGLELPPRVAIDDVIEVDERLLLGFPQDNDAFPEKTGFVARFKALSTIEALGSGDENIAQLAARARADQDLLDQLLRAYGYYDARVIRSIGGVQPGDETADTEPRARFDILPGTRYRFGAIDLGALDQAPDARLLRTSFGIKSGDPLNSDRILERKQALDFLLGETGYPFATIASPELLIDHERDEGDLNMPVDPGGKYAFAGVQSDKPEFLSSRHLQRIARFDPGETYQRSLEQDLRRAVLATGLVSTLTITPRVIEEPVGNEPGEMMLDVGLEPARLRTIAGAVGYGTEDGFKVQASWEHRNLFPPEGALKVRGILGTREQLAGVGFTRSNWRRRDQVLALDAYASDITTEAVDARTIAVRGSVERLSNLLFQKPLGWAVGAEVLLTDERNRVTNGIERPRRTFRIASLFGRVTLDGSDSLLDPTQGYRVTLFAAPEASRSSGETSFYVRARGDASYYQPVSEGVVLAGRASFATIQGAETFQIAPSRRLYAGGGGSVRGYGFQAIGPRNDFGEATGGRSLVEGSFEARIDTGLFDGAVQVVPFFDLGTVSTDSTPDFRTIKYGAGLGIRYKTGFGPIRVDVGVPLNPEPQDSPVAVYVSLGQAF